MIIMPKKIFHELFINSGWIIMRLQQKENNKELITFYFWDNSKRMYTVQCTLPLFRTI